MSLTGLGMLFIGIAFVILAIGVGRMLLRAAKALQSGSVILHRLPEQMDDMIKETNNLMRKGNDALADVHAKTAELTPLFAVLGDLGHGTKNMASWVRFQADMLEKKADALDYQTERKIGSNAYGSLALGYYLWKKRKELQRVQKGVRSS